MLQICILQHKKEKTLDEKCIKNKNLERINCIKFTKKTEIVYSKEKPGLENDEKRREPTKQLYFEHIVYYNVQNRSCKSRKGSVVCASRLMFMCRKDVVIYERTQN